MRTYVYSAKYNAFHPVEMKQHYLDAGTWPDDGIEVSEAIYFEFLTPSPGKQRIAGIDGLPTWADIPPLTPEQLQRLAESEKQDRISQATNAIFPLQYAVDLNMATTEEQALLTEWKKYCVLLNRVDCSAPPDIDWPKAPA
ncbi:tail fiber assembly protein [Xenorhabdus sp. 42]|uniref:tail fiber assembly protein n=1 Tax=Xenorhabdus szentirmaii TaxID=290112 RepID=UPI0019A691DE|nr:MULTISPECIES: tail fiber assembly protein [unclassified Xenorhabdus]MBD2819868.1 tail fiber assembly protein [Xenorhabdus sp. 42]MBD2825592.1 tail fiber assembly protein [Xenorhabdus sp. 5]